MSSNYNFDLACNKLCLAVADELTRGSLLYVHLNSPMRHYRDYVSMKVLGYALNARDQDDTRPEVKRLHAIFNYHSSVKLQDRLLHGVWKKHWQDGLRQQENWHPFDAVDSIRDQRGGAATLKQICAAEQWARPMIAERQLMTQGTNLYFVGANFPHPAGRGQNLQAWAISNDQRLSLDMACDRMITAMVRRNIKLPSFAVG